MYKVIKEFTDLQDNEYIYRAGDTFPHDGVNVSPERLKELSSSKNKLGTPLIKDETPKKPKKPRKDNNA